MTDVCWLRAAYGWGCVALAGALALQGLVERITPRVKKVSGYVNLPRTRSDWQATRVTPLLVSPGYC